MKYSDARKIIKINIDKLEKKLISKDEFINVLRSINLDELEDRDSKISDIEYLKKYIADLIAEQSNE